MSGMAGRLAGRLRLPLAVALGGLVALLLPGLFPVPVDAPSAVVLAAVAVAALSALVGRNNLLTTAPCGALAAPPRATQEPLAFLAARVTDPLHHPLRPRAPGLA